MKSYFGFGVLYLEGQFCFIHFYKFILVTACIPFFYGHDVRDSHFGHDGCDSHDNHNVHVFMVMLVIWVMVAFEEGLH